MLPRFKIHYPDGSIAKHIKCAFVHTLDITAEDIEIAELIHEGITYSLVIADYQIYREIAANGRAKCVVSFQQHKDQDKWAIAKKWRPAND